MRRGSDRTQRQHALRLLVGLPWSGGLGLVAGLSLLLPSGLGRAGTAKPVSPIYGVYVPEGYRDWVMVAPAEEAAPLDELRVVLANPVALSAYRSGQHAFPDGSVLVKLAWRRTPSADFAPATVPGTPTTVQVMVKDTVRFPDSGGWGFGRFLAGTPADRTQHETCFACHQARVASRDYVFTIYAP